MSNIPKCNLNLNGKDIYSSTTANVGNALGVGVSKVGGFLGGGLGVMIGSACSCFLLIIYLITSSNIVLLFFLCSLVGSIYSYYEAKKSLTSNTPVPTVSPNTPTRPCIDSSNVTLN